MSRRVSVDNSDRGSERKMMPTLFTPSLRNPVFAHAMRLQDVTSGVAAVAVGIRIDDIFPFRFISDYWEEFDTARAQLKGGCTIDLVEHGVCPSYYTGKWNKDLFCVPVEGEAVRQLHRWLLEREHTRAAMILTTDYPELFITDDEWRRLFPSV